MRSSDRRFGRAARRVAVLMLLLAAPLAACSGTSTVSAPGASVGQSADAALPSAVDNGILVSATGQRMTLASLTGKVVVISDVMTLCQETCPLDTADVVAAARDVARAGWAGKVVFLSITIDPDRDTVARLAAYQKLYEPYPPDWYALTGTDATLHTLWSGLGVFIQKVPDTPPAPRDWLTGRPLTYDLTHSDELFFLNPSGHERFVLDGAPHVARGAPVPAAIRRFMDATGAANLAHPAASAWTLSDELQVISWLIGHRVSDGSSS